MKKLIAIVALAAVIGGGAYAYRRAAAGSAGAVQLAAVERGDLVVNINATGTVEPEEVVDVGAQVAGKIELFGPDAGNKGAPIDYGSAVEEGTVLAHIDDSLYAADVASSEAQLEQARANVAKAKADLESKIAMRDQAAAGVELALITLNHLKSIPIDSQSDIELKTADATVKQTEAALSTAKANVDVARATLLQIEKAVLQSKATLDRSRTNLDYCTIRSPVKGVIIDRRVNIGQTVVSSLNAPSLFLIAKDLRRMQVWASVNEADIGHVHAGQAVHFTVDAHPGRVFHGTVGKIRLNATMTQNVVTYTVEINTPNEDGALLPYLTANVLFEVSELRDVLTVPNVALRWIPPPQLVAPDQRDTYGGGSRGRRGGRGGAGGGAAALRAMAAASRAKESRATETGAAESGATASGAAASAVSAAWAAPSAGGASSRPASGARASTAAASASETVWVVDGAFVRAIPVKAGMTDGSRTQIEGDGVREGMQVVVGEAAPDEGGERTTNPFAPQMFRRGQ